MSHSERRFDKECVTPAIRQLVTTINHGKRRLITLGQEGGGGGGIGGGSGWGVREGTIKGATVSLT